MQVDQVLHMKAGTGNTSYAQNSLVQRAGIAKAKPLLEECIRQLCSNSTSDMACLMVADLGCSSGPNALSIISSITNILSTTTCHHGVVPSEVAVFLNDLPHNDFNSIFKMLYSHDHELLTDRSGELEDGHYDNNNIPCFISGTPGSFYNRLFPANSLHFVHSSYSLHWLSQVPEGLIGEDGEGLNKGCLLAEIASPLKVHELYSQQFNKDFSLFLKHRSKEVVVGGRVLLTFLVRPDATPDAGGMDLGSKALNCMVLEGLIDQVQLNRFNIPLYLATTEEIKEAVALEGSFDIHKLETFSVPWDALLQRLDNGDSESDNPRKVKFLVNSYQAITESMFKSEFGEGKMHYLYKKAEEILEERFMAGKAMDEAFYVVASLVKRG